MVYDQLNKKRYISFLKVCGNFYKGQYLFLVYLVSKVWVLTSSLKYGAQSRSQPMDYYIAQNDFVVLKNKNELKLIYLLDYILLFFLLYF